MLLSSNIFTTPNATGMPELAAGVDPGHTVMGFVVVPSIEDVLRDSTKWNADWERAMSPANGFTPVSWYQRELRDQANQNKVLLDARYAGYPTLASQCLALQISLIQDVFTFRNKGFEEKWIRADPSVREKHVLIGLTSSCSAAHNLHDSRRLCATELNFSHLTQDGHHFLDLLRSVIPEDISAPPTNIKHFSNPDWDALRAHHEKSNTRDVEKLCYQTMLLLRTKLICHVLQNTFRSFLGLDVPVIKLTKVHAENKRFEAHQTRRLVPPGAVFGRSGCHLQTCPNGMHRNDDIPKEKQFLRCKECWTKLHREVKYCSRECQKLDWKAGHKTVCGKPFDFDTVDKMAAPAAPVPSRFTPVIGPAISGFKRSAALSYIVSALSLQPHADYLIMTTESMIDFVDDEAKTLFRTFREKALTTGDREAIAVTAHAICWWASLERYEGPVTPDLVVEQLRMEFSFDSLKAAIMDMEGRQMRDPLTRPPFLFKMDPTQWMEFVRRHRVVQKRLKFSE
ncbi:hypothetical protein B0H10DRAFT_2204737 [Mycena sp. CBHHK59/15]|nr:hypothetical protein B0H10DRAFT_2204737 [Mycena sp. CBHHK59/15]